MCAKEYLQQAYIIDKKIKLDLQKLEAAKASLQCRAVNYDRVGTSTNKNGIEEAIARVMDFENHINSEIKSLTELRSKIEKDIASVSDPTFQEVLTRRYLMYQKWEQIAEEMNYGVRHVFKLHLKALNEISDSALPDTNTFLQSTAKK